MMSWRATRRFSSFQKVAALVIVGCFMVFATRISLYGDVERLTVANDAQLKFSSVGLDAAPSSSRHTLAAPHNGAGQPPQLLPQPPQATHTQADAAVTRFEQRKQEGQLLGELQQLLNTEKRLADQERKQQQQDEKLKEQQAELVRLRDQLTVDEEEERRRNGMNFYVIGDWGWPSGTVTPADSAQRHVADVLASSAAQSHPAFVLSVGDHFYLDGVDFADDSRFVTRFEQTYDAPSLNGVPWYLTVGNHDCHGAADAQVEYSKRSTKWHMPARYFTETIRGRKFDVHLVVLDTCSLMCDVTRRITDPFDCSLMGRSLKGPGAREKQIEWLTATLERLTQRRRPEDWVFVMGHHPLFSVGPHGNSVEQHTDVLPLLHKHKVPVYFAGHDHTQQHISQATQDLVSDEDLAPYLRGTPFGVDARFDSKLLGGVHTLISGSGGYTLNHGLDFTTAQKGGPFAGGEVTVRTAIVKHGLMQVRLTAKSLVVDVIDDQGALCYRTLIAKPES